MDSLLGAMFILLAMTLANSTIMIVMLIVLTIEIRKLNKACDEMKNLTLVIARRDRKN